VPQVVMVVAVQLMTPSTTLVTRRAHVKKGLHPFDCDAKGLAWWPHSEVAGLCAYLCVASQPAS